jgi:hypothetical protein
LRSPGSNAERPSRTSTSTHPGDGSCAARRPAGVLLNLICFADGVEGLFFYFSYQVGVTGTVSFGDDF